MGRNGCPVRVLRKITRSWEDLYGRGIVRESMFVGDDEFEMIVRNAEEKFGLTDKDQYHELFWMGCKRLLGDEIPKLTEKARSNRPPWDMM